MRAGGRFRCAVRKREQSRQVDTARRDVKNELSREWYSREGWLKQRRRRLRRQRTLILDRLQELEQEATELA